MPHRSPASARNNARRRQSMGSFARTIRLALAATLLAAAVPSWAYAQAGEKGARYEAMLERVRKGDLNVDFQALRYAYAEAGGDRADRRTVNELVGTMFRAYKAKDFDGAIEAAKKVLAINYLDIDAHVVCDLSYRMLSNTISAEPCHEMASRLLRSISDSGDGAAPETAFRVIAVREEYSLLNAVGLKPVGRALVDGDGRDYDAVEVVDKGTGETRTVYFSLYAPRTPR
jgi:hypothetical protein